MFLNVIIDGRSALAADQPGAGERELVQAAAAWAAAHARTPVVAVVFAGSYEGDGPGMFEHDARTVAVATGDEPAADVIDGEVQELRAEGEPVIVVTDDADLASRATQRGAKVIGAAAFARTLQR